MKKTTKLLGVLLALLSILSLFALGCDERSSLTPYVSQLRCDTFYGENDSLKLKAHYGFIESPFVNDGKVGNCEYSLDFILSDKEVDNVAYSICFSFNGKDYEERFKLDPVKHLLTAKIPVDNFSKKEFSVTIKSGSNSTNITLNSLLPDGVLDYTAILLSLEKNQRALVNSFKDDLGNFNAEIYVRVLAKDNVPYYYVGFASGNDKLKALLVNALTAQVLAIREVF